MPNRTPDEAPDALESLNTVPITQEIKDLVVSLQQEMQEELIKREWWNNSIDTYVNLRYGIRNEKIHPWPKCANYVIPIIDSTINRVKPSYVQLVDIDPLVIFEPMGPEDVEPARKREILFNWRMKTRVNYFQPYVLGVDYLLEQGAVVFKVTWKYSTRKYTKVLDLADLPDEIISVLFDSMVNDEMLFEIIREYYLVDVNFEDNVNEIQRAVKEFREGKTIFEMTFVEIKDDQPELTPCSLRNDINFPIDTTDLSEARWIDYKFTMSKNDIKIAMRDERYEEFDDYTIDSWVTGYVANKKKRAKYNISNDSKSEDVIWLHESCIWYDVDGDGIEEKCIVTYPENNPSDILRFIELPYDHGMWPYVLIKREINDMGVFSSRGYPALLQDFQNAISTEVNQTIDNGTITNTPQIVVKQNALTNIRNLRYVPGNAVEVRTQTSDYEIRQLGNASQMFKMGMAQFMKAWADERVGNLTSGLSQANNMNGQGAGQNKTAKEIDLISALSTQTTSLDLQVFQQQMKWVYYQIDALYNQFGSEEEEVALTGQKPVKISRKEIQGRFNFIPNGNYDNTNPQLRLQKAMLFIKAFINDPDVKQLELKKNWAEYMDFNFAQSIFYTPEEKQMMAQQQMMMQEKAKQEAIQTQVGLKIATDNLDVRKAAMLQPIEGAKYKPD